MNIKFMGAAAALVLGAALAGCGGKQQFSVQGTITGLNNAGLVLANGSDTLPVPAGALTFTMPKQIDYGASFNVVVQEQPAHQTCTPTLATSSGSAGHTLVINALITCVQNSYTLGGKFTGLYANNDATATTAATPRTVVLLNGSTGGQLTVSSAMAGTNTPGEGFFTFGAPVRFGEAYGVTILSQPKDVSCTLTNGSGIMPESSVSNIVLTCVPKT
ncbi:hypothetical protein GTP23_00535 [Pseudoduganella sp. FT93W]|uniref:Lipoprotein n=1 Tax=Duganella fentianensis TaxID=2692177 RepID=A0A845HVJ9_9BURK|nr:hypothetical protein [Duganella fentianensis]MYN43551.1 hypothetical protein [Duganella fentianensis]